MKPPLILLCLALAGCAGSGIAGTVTEGALPVADVRITIVDEGGTPIDGAVLTLIDDTEHRAADGIVDLDLDGPVPGVVSADGMLDQPVVIDEDAEVRMLARIGADGAVRRTFHFAGDTMLARRYLDGGVEPADLATEVVAAVEALFSAADHSTVNLETVVGTLPDDAITPGKRWAIQSVPEITTMLRRLGVDLVTLGNNHVGDFDDAGVVSTLDTLERAGIPWVGAGLEEADAALPILQEVEDLEVSTASYLLPTGDANNDHLPLGGEERFAGQDERLEWQYEMREVALSGAESDLVGPARAGDVWAWFEENATDPEAEAEAWAQADAAFPELQDFGARRAHGGAALHAEESVESALAAGGAGIRIVQLHGGFQYQAAPSRGMVEAARHAIDSGADVVVAHHPHVLGGFEYYGDGLILWSLGNFVFDQELFATYRSGFARVVFEGSEILQASIVPLYLVDYRPCRQPDVPLCGPPPTWRRSPGTTRSPWRSRGVTPPSASVTFGMPGWAACV